MAEERMGQSLSSLERENPPPRRKSCQACVRARRRCDLASPACQRCAHRNISCQYPSGSRHVTQVTSTAPPNPSSTSELAVYQPSWTGCQQQRVPAPELPQPSIDMLNSCGPEIHEYEDPFDLLFPPVFDFSQTTPSLELTLPSKSSLAMVGTAQPRVKLTAFSPSKAKEAIIAKFQYGIDKMMAAPRQMLEENQMPWCHAHLYDSGMPRSMQDALSSTALHLARNDRNDEVIRQCIESRVHDLLSGPFPTNPMDVLAHAQALLTYQILRTCDTDPRIRSATEATRPHLEAAIVVLAAHTTFNDATPANKTSGALDILPLYPVAAARDFWREWVFQESARRTLSTIVGFLVACRYLRGEVLLQCDKHMYLCQSLTLSGLLWHADNPVDFAVAWTNCSHFVMTPYAATNFSIRDTLQEARGDEIDLFDKILLTTAMGIDEARSWLATKGGSL